MGRGARRGFRKYLTRKLLTHELVLSPFDPGCPRHKPGISQAQTRLPLREVRRKLWFVLETTPGSSPKGQPHQQVYVYMPFSCLIRQKGVDHSHYFSVSFLVTCVLILETFILVTILATFSPISFFLRHRATLPESSKLKINETDWRRQGSTVGRLALGRMLFTLSS